jgi:TolA-binding protein
VDARLEGLLLVLVGTLSCWVPKETGQAMQRDITALQQQQAANQKTLAEQQARLEEDLQRADRKIAEVTRTLEDLNRASHSTDADFGVQLERLIKEVQDLRGATELSDYRLSKIEGKLDGPGSITARLEALEKQVAQAAQAPPPAKEAPKTKKELFAFAADLLKHGKAAEARGVYRDIVRQWPNEPGVTDEAYYQIGESYFDEKNCRSALQEFIKVAEKFAAGSYADGAYYKIGLCSMEIGNLEDAKIFFSEIVRNYKKSPRLKDAQKKLDEVEARLAKEAKAKAKAKGKGK